MTNPKSEEPRGKYKRILKKFRNLLLASLGVSIALSLLLGLVLEGPAAPRTLTDYLGTFTGSFIALSFFSLVWIGLGLLLDPEEQAEADDSD